jgi:uncharacterized protein YcfJ
MSLLITEIRDDRYSYVQSNQSVVLAALTVPSVTMIGQMFLGCDRAASVAFFTVALTVNGAVCGGYLGNGLDIAPNFSGTVQQLTTRQATGVQVTLRF